MPRTRIKICGITNPADAAAAVDAGADALGVIFAPSPRQVTVEEAAWVLAEVPPPVARIGVFVDPTREQIEEAVRGCGLTAVQLCGHEKPALCDELMVPAVKVMHIGTHFDSGVAESYRGHAAALLLDTFVTGKAGGTSQVFDWQQLGEVPDWAPLFIAGGLNPDNVAACIAALHPFAVDVSSGVETLPGVKDHDKIAAFCSAVRGADLEVYR
jgi:phosphoribosylanthranilate isomerase